MVKAFYTPANRRLPAELGKLQKSIDDVQRPTGTERDRTMLRLQDAVLELQDAVTELQSQSVHTFQAAPREITVTTPGQYPSVTRNLAFPGPVGGGRVARLSLSGEFVRVTSSGNITIWLELLQGGVSTWKRMSAFVVGDTLSAPPAWGNPSTSDFIQVQVPDAAAANMEIRLHGHTFIAETVTARMQNITATLEYGARL